MIGSQRSGFGEYVLSYVWPESISRPHVDRQTQQIPKSLLQSDDAKQRRPGREVTALLLGQLGILLAAKGVTAAS